MTQAKKVSRRGLIGTAAATAAAAHLVPTGTASAAPADPGGGSHSDPGAGSPGDVIKVSSIGHDLIDCTPYLQQALDSDAATVIIDHVPGGWNTGPLFLRRSDVTVIIEPEVMLRSLTGAFPSDKDSLLTIVEQDNVVISGYGATFAMNKPEYKSGEWRMALHISGSTNVTVEGLVLRDSGGDGVYVGSGAAGEPNRNIVLRDLVCDNNRRQGLSVITVDGLVVEGCAFLNTNGTPPQSGIDFEPNSAGQLMKNVVVRDCYLEGNVSTGIQLYGAKLKPTSEPVSITVERTTIGRQIGGQPQVMVGGGAAGQGVFPGTFEVKDSLFIVGAGSGAIGTIGIEPSSVQTLVNRSVIWDWGNAFYFFRPIVVNSRQRPRYGNLSLTDVVVHTDQPGPVLHADAPAGSTVHGVHGSVTTIGPATEGAQLGEAPEETDVAVTVRREAPASTVGVRVSRGTVHGSGTASLIFTRSGGDLDQTLAVAYTTTGSARERYDYSGLGHVAVFGPGTREVRVELRIFARRRSSELKLRDLVISVSLGHGYQPLPVPARIRLTD